MDFSKLIAQGYTAVDILQSLFKKQPTQLNKIKKLISYGYAAPTILRQLSGDKKGSDESYMTSEERTFKSDESRRNETPKLIAGALGAAGGLGLLGKAGQAAGALANQGLQQAASNPAPPSQPVQLPNAVGPAGGAPPFPTTTSPSPQGQALGSGLAQALMQHVGGQQGGTQPQFPTPQGFPPAHSQEQAELFEKFDKLPSVGLRQSQVEEDYPHLSNTAEKYLAAGKTPEEAYDLLNKSKLLGGIVKRYEEKEGRPYLDAIKGQHQEDSQPPSSSVMMTPNGQVGDVFHIKDKTAILENDGKRFKADADTLEPIPKEWENLNIDLSQVPESDRSAPLSFVAPTEDKKELVVKFWTKDHKPVVYIYRRKDGQPFDEDTLNSISNEVDAPITNGIKFSGAWAQTGKSRGSAFFHKMNRMSQDANKENDASLPYVFVRAPFSFEHGFHKAVNSQFSKAEERFNAINNPKKR